MNYKASFTGWSDLTLSDLIVAYRKAKADAFFESGFPNSIQFAEYETKLLANLKLLLKQLKKKKGFLGIEDLEGKCRLIPKKLGIDPKKKHAIRGHAHFSKAERAFEHLLATSDLTPEFRVVGDFPVNAHIISAMWINMVGHKFDAKLDDAAYGARLRRVRSDEEISPDALKPYHITATGSFAPYFQPYQKWRSDGLRAIRNELDNKQRVIAVSLDLKSYYHHLDPRFIVSNGFLKSLELDEISTDGLTTAEIEFTRQISDYLHSWSKSAKQFAQKLNTSASFKANGGLAIGLTASRIISNVLLAKWDKLIRTNLTPVHYGRYVDDMFLVLLDPGTIADSESFMKFLRARLGKILIPPKEDDGTWEIKFSESHQGNSRVFLQAEKQKIFVLEGAAGRDLLDSIEKEITNLSSEHRLMPSPDQLEHSTAAKVLSASSSAGEEADTLRRADGLTIRRLSWALQLRHVETLANDLPNKEWIKERQDFYEFAHNHILRPEKIFAHYQHLPRLLGFAVSMGEWRQAEAIVNASTAAFNLLETTCGQAHKVFVNGAEAEFGEYAWKLVKGSLTWSYIDICAKTYPPKLLAENAPNKKVLRIAQLFLSQLFEEMNEAGDFLDFKLDSDEFYKKAPLLAVSDLARRPYKRLIASKDIDLRNHWPSQKKTAALLKEFSTANLLDADSIEIFLSSTKACRVGKALMKGRHEPITPYLFPTRPYSPSEIAEVSPNCVMVNGEPASTTLSRWASYVRALRGVWVKPSLIEPQDAPPPTKSSGKSAKRQQVISIGGKNFNKCVIGVTNLATPDECWAGSASGKPILTLERYKRICELVNQSIRLKPRPNYLIFPELSIPLRWVDSIADRLLASGISLIAGTEYQHSGSSVFSEAFLGLTDDRLGYPSSIRIRQPKLQPAVGEDKELTSRFGKKWFEHDDSRKPIYKHNDFHFGVMVCSELQNSKARIKFQGLVDALFILSWNKDLETFSALVESCALDVHAYTVLVNNRTLGDSRVRSPAKESFKRDLVRLRGGDNDFCVTAGLDLAGLRAFQSRAKRWPEAGDSFKPVPEGFAIAHSRRVLPPS